MKDVNGTLEWCLCLLSSLTLANWGINVGAYSVKFKHLRLNELLVRGTEVEKYNGVM